MHWDEANTRLLHFLDPFILECHYKNREHKTRMTCCMNLCDMCFPHLNSFSLFACFIFQLGKVRNLNFTGRLKKFQGEVDVPPSP